MGPQTFDVPWEPRPKLRPRVTFAGVQPRAYTPTATSDAEDELGWLLTAAKAKAYERGVPLQLEVTFRVARPKREPKAVHPVKRPDLDQYVKLVMDAADELLWWDDAQVVRIIAAKEFGTPGLRLTVTPLASVGLFTPPSGGGSEKKRVSDRGARAGVATAFATQGKQEGAMR